MWIGAVLFAITTFWCGTVPAREFRSADNQVENYPTVEAVQFMAKLVAERTNGRHTIRVFHSRQLGEEKDTIEAARVGAIDINRTNIIPLGAYVPPINVLAMPFLFRSADHLHKVLDGDIGKELLEEFRPHGFVGLTFYDFRRTLDLQQRATRSFDGRPEGHEDQGAAVAVDGRHDQGTRRRAGRAILWTGPHRTCDQDH